MGIQRISWTENRTYESVPVELCVHRRLASVRYQEILKLFADMYVSGFQTGRKIIVQGKNWTAKISRRCRVLWLDQVESETNWTLSQLIRDAEERMTCTQTVDHVETRRLSKAKEGADDDDYKIDKRFVNVRQLERRVTK